MKKYIWILVTLIFVVWAFVEQTKPNPNIWIQIITIALFFYSMMNLMSKVPSNSEVNRRREEARKVQEEEWKEQEEENQVNKEEKENNHVEEGR